RASTGQSFGGASGSRAGASPHSAHTAMQESVAPPARSSRTFRPICGRPFRSNAKHSPGSSAPKVVAWPEKFTSNAPSPPVNDPAAHANGALTASRNINIWSLVQVDQPDLKSGAGSPRSHDVRSYPQKLTRWL